MREPDVDGALVGGASLDIAEFASIARFKHHVGHLGILFEALSGPLERFSSVIGILQVVIQVVLGITSLLLTLLILLHRGRGGGLSDMFGGGVTSNLGASGVAERNLNRITVILGVVWIACIVVLGLITKFDVA